LAAIHVFHNAGHDLDQAVDSHKHREMWIVVLNVGEQRIGI